MWRTIINIILTVASEAQFRRESQTRSNAKIAFWTKITGIGTIIAAVSGTVAAGFFAWQSLTLQKQVHDNELQQAASISIENFGISGFPDHPVLTFDLKNTGPTRAEYVTADPEDVWTPPIGLMQLLDHGLGGRTQPSNLGFTVGPSETRHMTAPMGTAIPNEMEGFKNIPAKDRVNLANRDAIMSGRMLTIFAVWVTYRDIWGHTLHVSDCIVHTATGFSTCFGENRHS